MNFRVHALSDSSFQNLFSLSDPELEARQARRMVVDTKPGFPCRVSLEDADVGETVILIHHEHQPASSPYRASHAIFVREGARQAQPAAGEIPESIRLRLLSVRAFDERHLMVDADVVHGREVEPVIEAMLARPEVAYLHLHNAKPGCFAAAVTRDGETKVDC